MSKKKIKDEGGGLSNYSEYAIVYVRTYLKDSYSMAVLFFLI